jgi:hypothetical protein
MASSSSHSAEYSTVVRIDDRFTPTPATHELILNAIEPLHIQQFCRTMTLAQGHILYELWEPSEPWQQRRRGLFVPISILVEARKTTTRPREADWSGLHFTKVKKYEEAWKAVETRWPGIPIFGARKVVESLVNSRSGSGSFEVDQAVMDYALKDWTSYWRRLEARGVYKRSDRWAFWKVEEEVQQAVAERLREVLETWMRPEASLSQVEGVFEEHGLLQVEKQQSRTEGRWFL